VDVQINIFFFIALPPDWLGPRDDVENTEKGKI
jgi:hypothetical protein